MCVCIHSSGPLGGCVCIHSSGPLGVCVCIHSSGPLGGCVCIHSSGPLGVCVCIHSSEPLGVCVFVFIVADHWVRMCIYSIFVIVSKTATSALRFLLLILQISEKWYLSAINGPQYHICPTYPALLYFPSESSKDVIEGSAEFRSRVSTHFRVSFLQRCP